ncbi:CLUMA_CG016804, isoform A [Clunio marinus]|uniref:CLUMA_CG016804, isoform A n=1 Tax=Clunio marinus TaxID=568069 RepID=A0A1J1IVB9_9DIPT|nr:CLUMA_CG016804, isoform A [Clunio marinus]
MVMEENIYDKKFTCDEEVSLFALSVKNFQLRVFSNSKLYSHRICNKKFKTRSSFKKLYGQAYLLMADVVVITIKYRLGALRFVFMES